MRGRFVYLVAGVFVLTAVYVCCTGSPLVWDGAYQFNVTLIRQHPFVYCSRFHTFFLWQPFVLLSRYTHKPVPLYLAFGMPFLLAPAVGLLVSWWLVRRQAPWLILWVVFGVAVAALPGQFFIINDSIFQQHLFWPLFVAVFVRLDWRQWLVLAVLAVFQFVHPIGFVLLAGAAGAALVLAWADVPHRRRLLARAALGGLLAGAALWKTLHFPDPYAESELSWQSAVTRWAGGVMGRPLDGIMCMWGAAALMFLAVWVGNPAGHAGRGSADGGTTEYEPPAASERVAYAALIALAFLSALIGAGIWVFWAGNEQRWAWGLEFRRWVVPLTLPYFFLCWLDQLLRARREREARAAGAGEAPAGRTPDWPAYALYPRMCGLLAGVFAAVLVIQSTLFGAMIRRLAEEMTVYPGVLVPESAIGWRMKTALNHWTITDLGIAIQGRQPKKLLVSPEWVRKLRGTPGEPPVFPNYFEYPHPPEPNTNGWYDLRPFLSPAAAEPPGKGRADRERPGGPETGPRDLR